jgi:hypothetical protein
MKSPILLQGDDGLSWWNDANRLARHVESPDIEDGVYTVWDAEGQVLTLTAATPVERRSFFGIHSVSVSPGVIKETGRYEPNILYSVIAFHVKDVCGYKGELPADLAST